MTTLPTWLVVVLGLAGPVVAGIAILANELRDRRRLKHERESQRLEMEEQRLSKLREDRLRVYSDLARVTKVIEPVPPNSSEFKALANLCYNYFCTERHNTERDTQHFGHSSVEAYL